VLEKRGWKGLLVEPNPNFRDILKRDRPDAIIEECALVSFDYKESIIKGSFAGDEPGAGCTAAHDNIIEVPAKTLTSLLKKHNIKEIDFLSLDVEGFEIEALNGLDFTKYTPKYLLFEEHWGINHTGAGTYYKENYKDYLRERGYSLAHSFTDSHLMYKHYSA
jgi:FkbM family methyltransferase